MRGMTSVFAAAGIALATALPAISLVPTDSRIDTSGLGNVLLDAIDEGDGAEGDGSTATPTVQPTVDTITASAAASPLTEGQKSRIAAGVGACVGAKAASGAAVSDCFGSAPAADVVPAAQVARPRVTAASVRQEAVDQITLTKPDLQASPCLADAGSCRGTVGVPVWLWVGDGDGGLPSESASATAGRFSIQATAKVSKVKWSLGDGQSTVCSGAGTKYDEDAHGWSAPECGFENGWKKPGTYTLTATYVWDISWSGDQTGSATQSMSSTRQVTVGELQSVVSRN